ncbi:MAG: DUF1573 domain-containing protein [Bacteroidota bacterium]
MKIKIASLTICFGLVCFCACKNSQDDQKPADAFSSELIHNPATASSPDKKDMVPVITFENPVHDFGKLTKGEKVSYAFKFTNTGTGDLIIRHAQASCGCTVPEWPKEPLAPGAGGLITVTFDSEGKSGLIEKTVTIISNTIPNTTNITIKALIEG